jgi:uncharacterized protein
MNASLAVALGTGFVGSAHCLFMCGGPVALLTGRGTEKSRGRLAALAFHGGRFVAYVALGAVAGGLARATLSFVPSWAGLAFRVLLALGLVLASMELLGVRPRVFARMRLPAPLREAWAVAFARATNDPRPTTSLLVGLAWAFVPCGFLFSMVSVAASTGSVEGGATTMAAFALGTLPSLVGSTAVARTLARGATRLFAQHAKRWGAVALLAFALFELGTVAVSLGLVPMSLLGAAATRTTCCTSKTAH